MNNPFFAVANRILDAHTTRATYMKPRNRTHDIEWMTDKLSELAHMAYFVGDSTTARKIDDAATYWKQYGKKPALFTEDVSA